MERRLAAILAADVVGYACLMGIDEEGTLGAFKAHRDDLIEPKIAEHKGRVVKLMGDGFLAEFASVVDAVLCAIEVQDAMAIASTATVSRENDMARIEIFFPTFLLTGAGATAKAIRVAVVLITNCLNILTSPFQAPLRRWIGLSGCCYCCARFIRKRRRQLSLSNFPRGGRGKEG